MENKYFADTYAFMEILHDNKNYDAYRETELLTADNNIAELTYQYIKMNDVAQGEEIAKELWKDAVKPTLAVILFAMKFKYLHRKKRLSYTDCIGYCLALELGIPFLTGDKQFKDLPNVEFVH